MLLIPGDGLVDLQPPVVDGVEGLDPKLCDGDALGAADAPRGVEVVREYECSSSGEACEPGTLACACAEQGCFGGLVCSGGICIDEGGVEDCDDGGAAGGCTDGCTVDIPVRWEYFGVAHNVPVADLQLWEECWSSTYEAGPLVAGVQEECIGDHILLGCRQVDGDVMTLAAHAPRAAVFKEVNYDAKERSTANGVDFFWSPYYSWIGFGPIGEAWCGGGLEEESVMCWKADSKAFLDGWQCSLVGADALMTTPETQMWERVIFQAWD